MVLPNFEYIRAKTVDEASNLLQELGKGAKIMNGATDLIPPMNDWVLKPTHLIDIKDLPGMSYIEYDEKIGLQIGALTKLRDIELSSLIREKNPSVAEAAAFVASTQVRAKGTMAGNIANASPSNDTAPILLVQNAKVLVRRHDGKESEIPMSGFYTGFKKIALEQGDIITGLVIPPLGKDEKAAYIKHSVRKAMDLAIVGVAAWLKMDGNKCLDARIALGAVAITPMLSQPAAELLKGKEITDALLAEVSVAAQNSCKPISDVRASAEYRSDMIRVFTKRVIKKALEG